MKLLYLNEDYQFPYTNRHTLDEDKFIEQLQNALGKDFYVAYQFISYNGAKEPISYSYAYNKNAVSFTIGTRGRGMRYWDVYATTLDQIVDLCRKWAKEISKDKIQEKFIH